ncbi:MAG: hypothetical protein EOP21_12030 [Hyphomicrobiales bacterium]|nr:MAG: hypothetical protein EOP21_12030 [Hyphomicrobiales bacterium]
MKFQDKTTRRRGSVLALAASACFMMAGLAQAEEAKVDLAKDKVGAPSEMQDMSKYCGPKEIKVALADGYGAN